MATLAAAIVGIGGSNAVTFPNRDTTNQAVTDLLYSIPITLMKGDDKTRYLALAVFYTSSATVGTRSIQTIVLYKRRRLN
jgi:hypothetical protein